MPDFKAPEPAAEALPQNAQLAAYLDSAPRRIIPVDAPGAAVVIVKFNDYLCPACGNTYTQYKPLKAKWDKEAPGKVKWITKDFALDTECNAAIGRVVHPLACEAAAAVRMARKTGKAEAMEDWLYANQTATLDSMRGAVRPSAASPISMPSTRRSWPTSRPTRRSAASWASGPRPPSSSTASRCPTSGSRSWTPPSSTSSGRPVP